MGADILDSACQPLIGQFGKLQAVERSLLGVCNLDALIYQTAKYFTDDDQAAKLMNKQPQQAQCSGSYK